MSRSEPLRLLPPPGSARADRARPASGPADAQLLGQDGPRRGLRGGEAVLRQARAAYLTAEWSGADDRRPEAGLLVRGRL